ncbi:tripartite motif-containing protein 16-like isoform X1 [Polypterus senegalus]|uniref:tripartite motif-containing protein 16-like isoform X1 n=1 Tax=Polypterus senegalus TaxID=55291 RepID=UPI0019628FAE|nr:tripartite motif-containing protein 16-like isoform X1 [Polypterus senegalus]
MEFHPKPQLHKNTTLMNLIEKLKETAADRTPPQGTAGPDSVSCDVCPDRKRRASKTCMTCVVSFCETHLQPHLDYAALKRHKLEEPTGNLEEKLCSKHQRVLEMFCRTDDICVCLLCAATEHKSHDTKMLDEETTERKSQLESTTTEVKKRLRKKRKMVAKLKKTSVKIQRSANKEVQEHETNVKSALQSLERLRSNVTEMIRNHKQRELQRAKVPIEKLEKEIRELKSRDAELAELLQTSDHLSLVKKFPHLSLPPEDGASQEVAVKRGFLPKTLRKKMSALKKHQEEINGWHFVKTSEAGGDTSGDVWQKLESRNDFLKYSCLLTLDPNTAHRRLFLFEGNRMVNCEKTEASYPAHPDRFDCWEQILCKEALSGTRCYWEVMWSGKKAEIGVTYKGIGRKGVGNECVLGFNDKSWSLYCCDSSYSAWHNKRETQIRAPRSHRIGVYLDCPGGSLSFYSVSDTMTLLHKFSTSFNEPLYPGFGLGLDSTVTICPPLQLSCALSVGHSMPSVTQTVLQS